MPDYEREYGKLTVENSEEAVPVLADDFEDLGAVTYPNQAQRYALAGILGFNLDDDEWEHFHVLMSAMKKYHQRNAKHRGLWTYFGSIDSAFQARAKATRTYNVAIQLLRDPDGVKDGPMDDPLDDAVDMINYAVFFIRNVNEGRYG